MNNTKKKMNVFDVYMWEQQSSKISDVDDVPR